ncbi:response regulator transcription factor [Croceicoccus ponticola]|uniref:Response regulator transcription factor n=1 Tax=Croceicoccus ponticola TaxID=2217664 RepID=A0A437H000_9SPHN|nr:response regulator transcription factor [Croceicoccus ponticola]RVQ68956.1 response regulator transcription factor [Croceicoccus ponticola]
MKILIVDDEPAIIGALTPVLSAQGHDVSPVETLHQALAAAKNSEFDLVLLDLGLPDGDGIEIIAKLRELTGANIIVLSARHLEQDKIRALDEGADDYVNKPFGIGELLARLRVAQRRREVADGSLNDEFVSDQLYVHFRRHEVRLLGDEVKLSPKEFALLEVLCRNAGQVATQRKLLIAGWNDPHADGQYLRSYIALLRQKLEYDPSEPELILTEPGVGYRLSV